LKNVSKRDIVRCLQKDGWEYVPTRGAPEVYVKGNRRVVIHPHPGATYKSRKTLEGVLDDIGWSEDDLKRLKLIK
jgi:predicted RNA binding protein YcfA (HicA-like mRNA interferase family)